MKRALCVAATAVALVALSVSPASAKLISGASDDRKCDRSASNARVKSGYGTHADLNSVTRAQQRKMERQFRAALKDVKAPDRGTIVRIQTRFHVIQTDAGAGGVTNTQIDAQMAVLNQAFRGLSSPQSNPTRFRFRLASVDRTNNTDWYNWSFGDDDQPAKQALHQGTKRTLNIYTANLGGGLLGYATFPVPSPLYRDGVVLLNESLPGGTAVPYNEGDTATHEVGHWLNLYHTFQGGCVAPGDRVADTPFQDDGNNIFSCDTTLNTCIQPGRDPVKNFMSFGDDPCLDRFTAGQATRMSNAWDALRA